ncbi:MAG: hypothetical protein J6J11_00800 [Treponema sp.]|nr:hypothetical protein [Treponema sp.]
MVCKKLFFAIFLFSFVIIHAQESGNSGQNSLFVENSEETDSDTEENFLELDTPAEEQWQLLEWIEEDSDFVQYYEVIIERCNEKTGEYLEVNKLKTEDNTPSVKIQPLLSPGSYRYKVITFDLIGLPSVESDWMKFSIYRAFKPEINDISSKVNGSATLYLEEINDGAFSISGKNLFDLQKKDTDISFSSYLLVNQNQKKQRKIYPSLLDVANKNRKIEVQFDMKDLDVGSYDFLAIDASGLKSEVSNDSKITVKFKKRVDFDVSAGYLCPIILFDNTINHYMGANIWPVSATARASFMPFKHNFGYLGIGVVGTYTRMFSDTSVYSIDGNLITAHLNFIYQLPVRFKIPNENKRKHALTLELHGGFGTTYFNNIAFHFAHNIDSEPLNSINLSFDVGIALQLYVTNRLYTELCTDFVMAFMSDMQFGVLHPSVSIGWQF